MKLENYAIQRIFISGEYYIMLKTLTDTNHTVQFHSLSLFSIFESHRKRKVETVSLAVVRFRLSSIQSPQKSSTRPSDQTSGPSACLQEATCKSWWRTLFCQIIGIPPHQHFVFRYFNWEIVWAHSCYAIASVALAALIQCLVAVTAISSDS